MMFVRALKNVLAEYKKAEVYNSDITSSSAHSISPKDFEKKLYLAVCEIAKGDTAGQLSKFYLSRFGRELIARNDGLTADLDRQPDVQRVPTTPGTCIWQQPAQMLAHILDVEQKVESDFRFKQPLPEEYTITTDVPDADQPPSKENALVSFVDCFSTSEDYGGRDAYAYQTGPQSRASLSSGRSNNGISRGYFNDSPTSREAPRFNRTNWDRSSS